MVTKTTSSISQQIKDYRIKQCWSQEQMGKFLGVTQAAVSLMEGDTYVWTDLTIARLKKKMPWVEA